MNESPARDLHRVYALRHGTRVTSRSDVFLNYAGYGEPDGAHTVDYYFWVIETGGRLTVIDTGFDAAVAAARGRLVLHDPIAMLSETFGANPEDVDTVVVTHCHYDHIGNLHRFPNARVHIAQAELDFVDSGALEHCLVGHFTEPQEVDLLRTLRDTDRIAAVRAEAEILPGVRLIPVGGHTPGQLMVEVDTADGGILILSDALHFFEELERDMPFISSMDVPATYRAFADIRARLRGGVRHIIPGHDARSLDTMARISDDIGVLG